jgi:hypothetical protein
VAISPLGVIIKDAARLAGPASLGRSVEIAVHPLDQRRPGLIAVASSKNLQAGEGLSVRRDRNCHAECSDDARDLPEPQVSHGVSLRLRAGVKVKLPQAFSFWPSTKDRVATDLEL